jgi:hypothetical protein
MERTGCFPVVKLVVEFPCPGWQQTDCCPGEEYPAPQWFGFLGLPQLPELLVRRLALEPPG